MSALETLLFCIWQWMKIETESIDAQSTMHTNQSGKFVATTTIGNDVLMFDTREMARFIYQIYQQSRINGQQRTFRQWYEVERVQVDRPDWIGWWWWCWHLKSKIFNWIMADKFTKSNTKSMRSFFSEFTHFHFLWWWIWLRAVLIRNKSVCSGSFWWEIWIEIM